MTKDRYLFEIEGHQIQAEIKSFGIGFHGRAVSHTGYLHDMSILEGATEEDAKGIAVELFRASQCLPYLVGEEHRDVGWKSISKTPSTQAWQIRIPCWASESVRDVLSALGMVEICVHNRQWAFTNRPMPLDDFKLIIEPLLKPGTRLEDENLLAQALLLKLTSSGALITECQMDMFLGGQ
jgi:hypothetical protein